MSDDSNVWKADSTKNAKQRIAQRMVPSAPKKKEEGRTTRSTRSTRSKSSTTNTNTSNNNKIVQSINATARKRPPSKKKKNNPTIRSDPLIIQALEEANYEAYIDPYRGIMPYFSVSFPSSNNGSGGSNNNSSSGGGREEKESPWIKCQDVLLLNTTTKKKWNFSNPNDDDEVIDVDEEDSKSDSKSAKKKSGEDSNKSEDIAILVQTNCPTVDNWANDELEVYTKKLAVKNKKSNNARGKVRLANVVLHMS